MLAPAIGHNRAPGPVELAKEAMIGLSAWLKDTPVVETLEQARNAADQFRCGKSALADMETERKAIVGPLDTQVRITNALYRDARQPLEAMLSEIEKRVNAYRDREKARKAAEAAEARRQAEEAAEIARRAAFARDEALNDATMGVSEDTGQLIVDAEQAERRAGISTQIADGLERTSDVVRVRDNMGGRAIPDRNPKVLIVADAGEAIAAMGVTEKIKDAILSSARDFRREFGELPPGITETTERNV